VRSRRVRGLAAMVVAIGVVVAANVAAYGHDTQVDLSVAHRFTLSPETRALIRAVHAPLRIRAFLASHGGAADDARFLLSRYTELNSRIRFSVVDPDAHPGEARRFGITRYASVVLTYRGRRVDAPDAEELEISTAILRLLRGHVRPVCVLTGHGEPALDDTAPDGLSAVADLLRHNAYEPQDLDLSTSSIVPKDCAAVIVAGPTDPLLPAEVQAIDAYTKADGRLMVLATPTSRADPNPLIASWGMRFTGGLVIDPARSENLDFANVIVERFPSASPVDAGVSRLQLPAGGGLFVAVPPDRPGLSVARLALASGRSFVETRPDTEIDFDGLDIPGPVLVAAAADDSRVVAGETGVPGRSGARIERTRVVVAGDVAFVTNRFLDHLSNARFLLNGVNWLTEEEQLLATTSRPSADRPLPFTGERQARVLAVTVGAVPGAIVAVGVLPTVVRRVRRRRR